MLKVTQGQIDQVEIDLDALSAEDFSDLAAAEQRLDLRGGAAVLAKVVKACPWGAADDPASYSKLPVKLYFALSRRIGKAIGDEAAAEKK